MGVANARVEPFQIWCMYLTLTACNSLCLFLLPRPQWLWIFCDFNLDGCCSAHCNSKDCCLHCEHFFEESKYKIKHDIIYHNCLACGAREMVDMQHKLATYILAQNKKAKKLNAKDKKKDGDSKDDKKKKRSEEHTSELQSP